MTDDDVPPIAHTAIDFEARHAAMLARVRARLRAATAPASDARDPCSEPVGGL